MIWIELVEQVFAKSFILVHADEPYTVGIDSDRRLQVGEVGPNGTKIVVVFPHVAKDRFVCRSVLEDVLAGTASIGAIPRQDEA